jgi:hypothetical protein
VTPWPVPWKWKWPFGALVWATALGLYAQVNHLSFQRATPQVLNALDRALPFWPWTVWVYLSGLLYVGVCWYLAASVRCFHRQAWALLATVAVSCVPFLLFPARFPREVVAFPSGPLSFSEQAVRALWGVDHPSNTTPSLHASLAVVLALDFRWDDGYPRAPAFLMSLWAAALVASALTTRQHTAWDVATGVCLGVGMHLLLRRLLPR